MDSSTYRPVCFSSHRMTFRCSLFKKGLKLVNPSSHRYKARVVAIKGDRLSQMPLSSSLNFSLSVESDGAHGNCNKKNNSLSIQQYERSQWAGSNYFFWTLQRNIRYTLLFAWNRSYAVGTAIKKTRTDDPWVVPYACNKHVKSTATVQILADFDQ